MDLSIIVLSYNTKDVTEKCLQRLQVAGKRLQVTGYRVQIIVLDNASADGSAAMIRQKYPEVELIESKENTGYSKGNNIAFKRAKYPVVLFLNSDVYVEEDTLERVLAYFKNPDCDVLGVKLFFDNRKFQPSAGNLPNPINTIFWILGVSALPVVGQLTSPIHPNYAAFFKSPTVVPVGWVTGAFLMIKKEVFEKVKGFDEGIFMYMDEVDLCKRIKDEGHKIWYASNISATHLHGASSNFDMSRAFVSEIGGIKVYFKKYFPYWYPLVKLFLILGLVLRVLIFSLLGKAGRARAYVEGLSVI